MKLVPLVAALCLAAWPAVGPAATGTPGDFVGLFKAATAAHDAGDYAAMEARLREALALRPGHPAALYNLAAAQARRGQARAAVATLEQLAAMGLAFSPEVDPDFEKLGGDGGYRQVLAHFARNRAPAGDAQPVLRVYNPRFIPDGLAYDMDTGSYFVSGAHARTIARLTSGATSESWVLPGAGGMLAPLGMVADSRRRLLWVTHAGIPEMRDADEDELGRSGVIAIDIDSGQVRRRALLKDVPGKHRLGDIVLGEKADAYVTDSEAGILYRFNTSRGKFEPLTKAGQLSSPQGMALSEDKKTLYVADYAQGLFAYDLETRQLARVEAADGVCLYGIDGLYRYKDMLVAVQNGVRPHRVVRFKLDPGGRRVPSAYVLAANLKEFDEPTLGVIVGDRFNFIANSQWNKFDKDHRLPPPNQLRLPVVLRLSLDAGL